MAKYDAKLNLTPTFLHDEPQLYVVLSVMLPVSKVTGFVSFFL